MSDPVLTLKGIRKAYNAGKPTEVNVLRGIDLTVGAGEIVALVAPSGAGKSTLLHIAGLLDTPDTGTVEIADVDMTGESDRKRTAAQLPYNRCAHQGMSSGEAIHGLGTESKAIEDYYQEWGPEKYEANLREWGYNAPSVVINKVAEMCSTAPVESA